MAAAHKARTSYRKDRKRTKAWVTAQHGRMTQLFDEAGRKRTEALGRTRQGFTDALRETDRVERTGIRKINERERSLMDRENQRQASSGLGLTSASGTRNAQIAYDSDRSLDEFLTNFA